MTSELQAALNFDSLAVAEKIVGGRGNDAAGLGLMLQIDNSAKKKKLLSETNDVHFNMRWNEYKEVIEDIGFKIQLANVFRGDGYEDEEIIAFDFDRCCLLFATSYWGYEGKNSTVNAGNYYLQLQATSWKEIPEKASGGMEDDTTFVLSFDAREAIRYTLDKCPPFQKPWKIFKHRPFIWLLNYTESKGDYNHEAISRSKIKKLSPEIRAMINL